MIVTVTLNTAIDKTLTEVWVVSLRPATLYDFTGVRDLDWLMDMAAQEGI